VGSPGVIPLGSASCSKKIDDGPMNMALLKIKKKNLRAHP